MKTITKLIIIFCILTLVSIYFSIPDPIRMSKIINLQCATESINRFLGQKGNWQKIWPGNIYDSSTDNIFSNGDTVHVVARLRNTIQVMVHHRGNLLPGSLIIIPLSIDSSKIEWRASMVSSMNPVMRIIRYRQARHINRMMIALIRQAKDFLEKKENLYGIPIEKISTKDTFLVATRGTYSSYPATADIYNLVGMLRKYITDQNANVTGNPIMNVNQLDKAKYELMVAVPTNKELPGEKGIFFRRMVPGNFISTQVKGGNFSINNAFSGLQLYMEDYKKTRLAIPFMSLVTDRVTEPDTSKWITRIYFPSL